MMSSQETEYHSKDFEWQELRQQIENDPTLRYHFLPYIHQSILSSSSSSSLDSQSWNQFHARHVTGKFFKERRYLFKEFPELASCEEYSKVLEVGCGNASTALPILRGKENIIVFACDCSTEALERATETIHASNVVSAERRFRPFCWDVSTCHFPKWLICDSCHETAQLKQNIFLSDFGNNESDCTTDITSSKESDCCIGGVDYVTLIFTLSAVPLHRMSTAVAACFSVLKPGGLLFFRDYGLYDMTMLRFEPDQRVGFREYKRSDGTRSYFFSLDSARDLFLGAGFTELELEYCCVKSVNRRKQKMMRRVWVHGKFQKPM
ncbi:methyltransferase-like protein 6 isoform X2 [Cynara cardunculus var. scolymus]|uniref:tRNA N(3)-methylcytidine methyltransferase n=1 Tax=Cynara cardunculus var. scolymus TaxID=59895 RepID=A0A124SGF7_CYNCS|nr:methyltransferase-like protein 6 isoform X2 [Cynara cardunculus var. scolymus]KVI06241.1 Methyltransferase-like protein [Cynara cardunculus var. scolymus]